MEKEKIEEKEEMQRKKIILENNKQFSVYF